MVVLPIRFNVMVHSTRVLQPGNLSYDNNEHQTGMSALIFNISIMITLLTLPATMIRSWDRDLVDEPRT